MRVRERLVVDTQIVVVAMLNDRQTVLSDVEWIVEGALIPIEIQVNSQAIISMYLRIVLINDLTILRDFLLSTHDAVVEFYRVVAVIQLEAPRVLVLRPVYGQT